MASVQFSNLPSMPLALVQWAVSTLIRWQSKRKPFPGLDSDDLGALYKMAQTREPKDQSSTASHDLDDIPEGSEGSDPGAPSSGGPSSGGRAFPSDITSSDVYSGRRSSSQPPRTSLVGWSSQGQSVREAGTSSEPDTAPTSSQPPDLVPTIAKTPFATGTFSQAYQGSYGDAKCVVKRMFRPLPGLDYEQSVNKELQVLRDSMLQQRRAVPALLAVLPASAEPVSIGPKMVLEYAGVPMDEWMEAALDAGSPRRAISDACWDALTVVLDAFLEAGWEHGDLHEGNILLQSVSGAGHLEAKATIVDLAACRRLREDDAVLAPDVRAQEIVLTVTRSLWPEWWGN